LAFNLSCLDTTAVAESGAVMKVRNFATGEVLMTEDKKPVTIVLAGEDSERFKKADFANRNRRIDRMQGGVRGAKASAAELDSDNLEMLVAVTIGWSNIAIDGDDELPFSHDNARVLYTKLPWLREQAQAFVLDRTNFLKA
jgi:hypothetical protein